MTRSSSRSIAAASGAALTAAALAAPATAPAVPADAHAAAKTITISAPANGDNSFSRKKLSAPAGTVVLRLRNPAGNEHAIALGRKKGKVVSDGGVSRISVKLRKGRYTYYCPVEGHRADGMRGTLTVG
jgi:plastocyanin